MNKFFMVLAFFIANFLLMSSSALAASNPIQYTWDGPPCQGYAICSIDPPAPGFDVPCYTGQSTNATPTKLQMDFIGMCQAARNMLIVPPEDRALALAALTQWVNRLTSTIQEASLGISAIPKMPQILNDLFNMGNSLSAYKSNPSTENWNQTDAAIYSLGTDTEISD